jgi:hypothetical protein
MRSAVMSAWARLATPSFSYSFEMCVFAVCSDTNSCFAMPQARELCPPRVVHRHVRPQRQVQGPHRYEQLLGGADLDRYTHQALLTGRVSLPGRSVHAGVWFRLLRTLLHEVSLSPTTAGRCDGRTLEIIWQSAGYPIRAGLGTWQPYEQLPWPTGP